MIRASGGKVIAIIAIIVVFILVLQKEESAGSALLPYLPVLPKSHSGFKDSAARRTWLRERMALSEKAWQKSVEGRAEMAATHPDNPRIPFFPMDFLRYPFTIWDFFPATWSCPHDFQRVGRMGDGGKWVCGMSLYENLPAPDFKGVDAATMPPDQGLVMYSFGINNESSFEAEMLERVPSARIWGYDYSVDAWGPQIPMSQRHRTFFKKAGLGKTDDPTATPPFFTLPSIMKENGHNYIDILKIDVEGSEYDALDVLMDAFDGIKSASGNSVIPIGQVMIELHLGNGIDTDGKTGGGQIDFDRFKKWWERLERMGMRPAWIEINLFAVTLFKNHDPRCTEYVWVNARDERNVLWQ